MSKQAIKPTDQEIDALLAEIEGTLNKAEMLAKSSKLAKDEDSDSDKPEAEAPAPAEAPAEEPAPEAPAAEAAPSEEPAPPEAPEAPEAPAAEGEESLEGEQEAPLSDEELDQIYGAMDPEELERHYMMIRQHLQSAMAKMEEEESKEEEKKEEAKEEPKEEEKKEDMEKSEKIAALEQKLADSDKKLELMAKAIDLVVNRPTRKAVTGIEYIQKSEPESKKPLSESEVKEKVRQFKPSELSKSEREAVNAFLLHGEQKADILKSSKPKEVNNDGPN